MPPSRRERIQTVLYMLAITAASTAVVASVNALTHRRIEDNRHLREVRGLLDALGVEYDQRAPAGEVRELAKQCLKARSHADPDSEQGLTFHEGLDRTGTLIGYVFPIGGAGFWGPIRGYLALDPEQERIIGMTFVRHAETPGLGARIEEDAFRSQFVGKRIKVPEGSEVAIRLVQAGRPKGPQDVDAITGATGTSRAVERFLNENLARIRRFTTRDESNQ